MSSAFPLVVNGLRIGSSEALYQACRFPDHPEWQREILDAPHPMRAKMTAKKEGRQRCSRADWDDVRIEVMRWCLQVKLAQHFQKFGSLLLATGERAIAEQSRHDAFWGAVPDQAGVLRGANVLGRLLVELRDALRSPDRHRLQVVTPPKVDRFLLLGQPIQQVDARSSAVLLAAGDALTLAQTTNLARILAHPRLVQLARLSRVCVCDGGPPAEQVIQLCREGSLKWVAEAKPTPEITEDAGLLIVACAGESSEPSSAAQAEALGWARAAGCRILLLHASGQCDLELED